MMNFFNKFEEPSATGLCDFTWNDPMIFHMEDIATTQPIYSAKHEISSKRQYEAIGSTFYNILHLIKLRLAYSFVNKTIITFIILFSAIVGESGENWDRGELGHLT